MEILLRALLYYSLINNIVLTYLFFGGSQVFSPRSAYRILVTSLDQVSRYAVNCSTNGSYWADHLCPNFLEPPMGFRSDLISVHQFFFYPPWCLFQESYGSTRRIRWGRYSGGLCRTWPSYCKRRFLTVITTSLLILQSWRISALDIRSCRRIPSIWRKHPCSKAASVLSRWSFKEQNSHPLGRMVGTMPV